MNAVFLERPLRRRIEALRIGEALAMPPHTIDRETALTMAVRA